ncbi:MAG TPA: ribokinase [Thermomicrobiales bacterium]|nr:ribokinase [Thermomicrobiales bacterium]
MTVRALVVGSLVMDLSFRVPKRPEPGEVIIAESFGRFRGGKGYNQAVALARLGADVAMIGAVGDDPFGSELKMSLIREGVDATGIQVLTTSHTSVAVPLVTPDGDVGFVHSPGANHALTPLPSRDIPACDVLFIQGEVPAQTSLAVAVEVRRRGGRVFLNPAPVHDVTDELLAAADILCANEIEAIALSGADSTTSHDPRWLADALARDGRTVVITLGSRGAAYVEDGAYGAIAPPRIDAIDATGAGDSFCAALGLSLGEGRLIADAARIACAAGAHAATVRGAEPGLPTREQVDALLSRG